MTAPHHDSRMDARSDRPTLSIHLGLGRGVGAAAADVEVHEGPGGRIAHVALSGSIVLASLRRFERLMIDLSAHDLTGMVLDCARLGPIEDRGFVRLIRAVAPFAKNGGLEVRGLSVRLRERLRALEARRQAEAALVATRRAPGSARPLALPVSRRGRAS